MVKNIEKTITRLAASVHSPKNRFATKNAYGELCRRIGIRAMSANDADRSSRRLYMRTAVAASLALVVGIGIAVEKGQQKGGAMLREEGYHLESIAIIDEMNWETQEIKFRNNR